MPTALSEQAPHCPICESALELRQVAPCMDCGAAPREIGDWQERRHTYGEYQVFGMPLVLCDFCDADFESYRVEYLGIGRPIGDGDIQFIRDLPGAQLTTDLVCPRCEKRLAFLSFLAQLRAKHAA